MTEAKGDAPGKPLGYLQQFSDGQATLLLDMSVAVPHRHARHLHTIHESHGCTQECRKSTLLQHRWFSVALLSHVFITGIRYKHHGVVAD